MQRFFNSLIFKNKTSKDDNKDKDSIPEIEEVNKRNSYDKVNKDKLSNNNINNNDMNQYSLFECKKYFTKKLEKIALV